MSVIFGYKEDAGQTNQPASARLFVTSLPGQERRGGPDIFRLMDEDYRQLPFLPRSLSSTPPSVESHDVNSGGGAHRPGSGRVVLAGETP
jgi:hypothetical protein